MPEQETTGALDALFLEAGRAWVEANTAYRFADGAEPPPGVRAFLLKYREVMAGAAGNVQSESIGGMSQSFRDVTLEAQLIDWAAALLPEYFRSGGFVAATSRWEGRY